MPAIRTRRIALAALAALLAWLPPAHAQPRIDREVVDRFRLLDDPADLDFLEQRIKQLVAEEAERIGGRPRITQPMRRSPKQDESTLRPAKTAWNEREARYPQGWAFAERWRLKLSVTPSPGTSATCNWSVDGAPQQGSCAGFEPAAALANGQRVAVTVRDAAAREPRMLEWTVAVADRLILALGDSYGSGEGYPDVSLRMRDWWNAAENRWDRVPVPGQWWDQRCHRSLFSGPAMAAVRFAHERRRESTTFMSYACSGAEVEGDPGRGSGGLLTGYEGREIPLHLQRNVEYFPDLGFVAPPNGDPLPAQLHAAMRDLCRGRFSVHDGAARCEGELRVPDAVVVSIGGNDLGFGEVIRDMILGSCRERCIREIAEPRLPELAGRYDKVAAALAAQLRAPRVLLMEYPNPTRYDDGAFCDDRRYPRSGTPGELRAISLGLIAIGEKEYALAHDRIYVPLLKAGADATRRHAARGWQRLPIMREPSDRKGVCARSRWINDPNVALSRIGMLDEAWTDDGRRVGGIPTGSFHPNFYGYFNYALRIREHLDRALPPSR